MQNTDDGRPLTLPEGSSLDLALLRDVASVSNRAHQALGTELLSLDRHGVVLGIERPPDDAMPKSEPVAGEWPNGIITSLLDHGCAIAALVSLDDPARFGGSLGIHVEYVRPSDVTCALHVRAECHERDDAIARLRAVAFHPDRPEVLIATASAAAAVSTP